MTLMVSGAAYVFQLQSGSWHQIDKLVRSDRSDRSFFGASVAIDGETMIIGAENDTDLEPSAWAAFVLTIFDFLAFQTAFDAGCP